MKPLPSRREFVKQSALAGAWLCTAATHCPSAEDQAIEPLTQAEFEKLHAELQPPKDELWRTIPWKTSILDACKLAAQDKKPLVMRVRSGHPLGCV
jgi:hypothetical protein